MQVLEFLFLLLFAASIAWLIFSSNHARPTIRSFAVAGAGLFLLGVAVEGWRWQMLPAQLGFLLLVLASISGLGSPRFLRAIGIGCLVFLLTTSAFLAHQLPILTLPEPDGPFGVGTFEYSVTDTARIERFAPDRKRELYVEVWYPADADSLAEVPVESLYHELYEGDLTIWSFLASYLGHIETHSHVGAPLAVPTDEAYPVLLFNHGLDGFTSQNQLLMEHLASHGYIVLSIAHPYESIRVNLANAGTVRAGTATPGDIDIRLDQMQVDLLSKIEGAHGNWEAVTAVRRVLLALADAYGKADDESARRAVIAGALERTELQPYRQLLTEKSLTDYLRYVYLYQGRAVEYWVEDIQFIADSLAGIEAPIDGFPEAMDADRIGVFGMSMGGAAAGEFCKIDSRCSAGANLDGTQGGRHWDSKVAAPFLMIYHESHRGGNDFAYLPPTHEFVDLTVTGTMHFDFVDMAYTIPLLKTLGLAGSIDASKTIQIVNGAHLDFFDRHLKGISGTSDVTSEFSEVVVREHEIATDGA